jgi:hypothetical protein
MTSINILLLTIDNRDKFDYLRIRLANLYILVP